MTVISARHVTPALGKMELAMERARTFCGIASRFGAKARVGQVIAGAGAGQVRFYSAYESFAQMGKAAEMMAADPSLIKLRQDRDHNPAGEMEGPIAARRVYGTPHEDYKITLQREWHMPRGNLSKAIEILPEIEAMGSDFDIKVNGVVPVMANDLDRLMVVYWAKSLEELGNSIDHVGMSEAFQKKVVETSELGTLLRSRVLRMI